MSVRRTSIQAYNTIKENGLLSKRRLEVYEALFHNGPMSQNETSYFLRGRLDWGINPRFSELKSMGAITEVGKRVDAHTGMTVILWDVTDQVPVKFDAPIKHKCKHCDGKGYFLEQQGKLF